jgi:ABC-2 type transport system permease protein
MTAVARVYRWELVKLLAQKRTYLGLGAAMLVPVIFVVVLQLQSGGPNDVPLGRYIRDSGIVTPLVVLLFMSIWGFPLITALVAGDIVASETNNGTLKTILTRSRERGQVFVGSRWASSASSRARSPGASIRSRRSPALRCRQGADSD